MHFNLPLTNVIVEGWNCTHGLLLCPLANGINWAQQVSGRNILNYVAKSKMKVICTQIKKGLVITLRISVEKLQKIMMLTASIWTISDILKNIPHMPRHKHGVTTLHVSRSEE